MLLTYKCWPLASLTTDSGWSKLLSDHNGVRAGLALLITGRASAALTTKAVVRALAVLFIVFFRFFMLFFMGRLF